MSLWRYVVLTVLSLAVTACVEPAGRPAVQPSSTMGVNTIPGEAVATCPVTTPGHHGFEPAAEAPEDPPSVYDEVWYGSPDLWTMIDPEGEIDSKRWLEGDKTFWWSRNYSRHDPGEIVVTAHHLEASAPAVEERARMGGGHSPFMLQPTHESVTMVGIELPEPGCWQLTGDYKGATLTYVVWVGSG